MPASCTAYGCNNRSTKESKERGISFHQFPFNDKIRLKQWLIKMRRKNFQPSTYSRLCSEHFTDEDFEYQLFTNRRGLKKTAIPSKFCFTETEQQAGPIITSILGSEIVQVDLCEASTSSKDEKSTQTDESVTSCLLEEINRLQTQITKLQSDYTKSELNPETLDDNHMNIFTGFTKNQFNAIHLFLNHIEKQRLFIFFMKLKTGMTESMMSFFFRTSQSSISRTFTSVTDLIYNKICTVGIWPAKSQIMENMPYLIKISLPQCRVIVDCTEFPIQKPSSSKEQQLTFSKHKNTNTVKCLIGITPAGDISFISEACGGSVSDKELFLKCGIIDVLEPGDIVLADRGFDIKKEVEAKGCKVFTPGFLKDKIQFHIIERTENKKKFTNPVLVERAILRIKQFKFFNGQLSYNSLHSISKLIYITAFFTNFDDS